MSQCKYCHQTINWIKIGEKNTPLNEDGVTVHRCKDGIPQAGTPISTAIPNIQQGTTQQYAPKQSYAKGDDLEKQRIIVWQNMMSHAIEAIKMTGNFNDTDDAMARRILFVTDLLFEASMCKWRTGKLVGEIPAEVQAKINAIT